MRNVDQVGRVEQMKKDLITVAVIVPLLIAVLMVMGLREASAQSAAEDQYYNASGAGSDQYTDPSSTPTSPAPSSGTGSGGSPPTQTSPVEESPLVGGSVDGVRQTLTNLVNSLAAQGASNGTSTPTCNPAGAYGGLAGWPGGCDMGTGSTNISGQASSGGAPNGGSGSFQIPGYVSHYQTVAEQLASPSAPLMAGYDLVKLLASVSSAQPTQPSDTQRPPGSGWNWVQACSPGYTLSCFPNTQWPIL